MAGTTTTTTTSRASPSNTTSSSASKLIKGLQFKSHEGDISTTQQQQTTPVRPGKRRHQASVSPVTARSESRSPRAKQRPAPIRQSPPTVTATPTTVAVTPTITGGMARSDSCNSGSVSPSQLAVPRVSAEPPCPSKLPMPPMHWMTAEEKDNEQRQSCRAATESLLSHLTTSGILVTA